MLRESASCSTPRSQNQSSIFAAALREDRGNDSSSRPPSMSSRGRYHEKVLGSSIPFETVATSLARCQSARQHRPPQNLRQQVEAAPTIFAKSNCSSRAPSVEQSPSSSFRRSHEEQIWRSERSERNGKLADLLFGRSEHGFGADALPRNARGTTGFSRGRAPPGGPSVLGSSGFHSPVFANQSRRPSCATGTMRWEELSANGVHVPANSLERSSIASASSSPRRSKSATPRQHKTAHAHSMIDVSARSTKSHPSSRAPAGQNIERPFRFHDEFTGIGERAAKGRSPLERGRSMFSSTGFVSEAAADESQHSARRNKTADVDSMVAASASPAKSHPSDKAPAGQHLERPFRFHDEFTGTGKRAAKGRSTLGVGQSHQSMFYSTALFSETVADENQHSQTQPPDACASASASSAPPKIDSSARDRMVETGTLPQEQHLFHATYTEWHVPGKRRDAKCPVRAAAGTALAQSQAELRTHPTEPLPKKVQRHSTAKEAVIDANVQKLTTTESSDSTCCSTPQPPPGRTTRPLPARSRSSSVASQSSVSSSRPHWR